MFETRIQVDDLDARQCADALHDSVMATRRVGAERLARVAHWADLHHPDRQVEDPASQGERRSRRVRVPVGAEGTPVVSEFAIDQLGIALQTTTTSASILLRDALELRHRMPCLWAGVMAGEIDDWKARQVVRLTRVLTEDQCAWVDNQVMEALIGLPYGRALTVIEGAVIAADPQGHEQRRLEAEHKRYVALGRRTSAGVQTLFARGAVGDMTRLMAMVNHLAGKLAEAGDQDSADDRRAKALGLLGNPALACAYLARTATPEPEDQPEDEHESPVHDAATLGRALEAGGGAQVLERLRPRTVLYLHAHVDTVGSEGGVVRVEGLGALGVTQLREWLHHDQVVVKPVAYPLEQAGVDSYEIPRPLAEAMRLVRSYEVFPYGTQPSRAVDLDHTAPFRRRRRGGPPQTWLGNLGPLGRRHHRAKTFGGLRVYQPVPGTYYWQMSTGRWYRVDRAGTRALDHTTPEAVRLLLTGAGRAVAGPLLAATWLEVARAHRPGGTVGTCPGWS